MEKCLTWNHTHILRMGALCIETDDESIRLDDISFMGSITDDIKECANACDTYYKRSAISRLIVRRAWEDVLGKYCEAFRGHQDALRAVLSNRSHASILRTASL